MKKWSLLLPPVVLGLVGAALRLAQVRLVIDPDTGLARSHPLSILLPLYLLAVAVLFLLRAWPCRGKGLSLAQAFRPPAQELLPLFACAATTFFGVLSSLIDTGLFTGFHEMFWQRFAIIYVRGASFYITQIVCNAVTFTLLFFPFTSLLRRLTPAKLMHINKRKSGSRGEKTRENSLNCIVIK